MAATARPSRRHPPLRSPSARRPAGAGSCTPARSWPAGAASTRCRCARSRSPSQVALGTLYRYFPSKVHLLVATMQDQLEHMHGTLRKKPPTGDTPAERVAETLMRAFRALQREPHLADAMVRALTFADRSVSPEVDTVSRQTTAIILDAMGLDAPDAASSSRRSGSSSTPGTRR